MLPPVIRQASAFIIARKLPGYRRFLHNEIDFSEPLVGIKGARGCGKTTLMLQYARSSKIPSKKILYVACDHPAMVDIQLYDLAQTFYQEGGKLLLIDEIHKARNFGASLKAIRDTFQLQVIFSGSSALQMDHSLADLSRRATVYKLPVLSFREFLELETGFSFKPLSINEIIEHHQNISAEICSRIRPIEYFKKYIKYGAYPFFLESRQSYGLKLLEVINLTIDSDLSGIFNINPLKLDRLKKILYMLCTTPPMEINKSRLSGDTGASWPTLSKYLERMEAGSLIHRLRAGQGMRTVRKPDKLLLDNPNLFQVLCASPDVGSLRESFFVSQIMCRHQVHYHSHGDFIIDDRFIFEVGGASKTPAQLKKQSDSFVAADDIETGAPWQIPLWMFGMEY